MARCNMPVSTQPALIRSTCLYRRCRACKPHLFTPRGASAPAPCPAAGCCTLLLCALPATAGSTAASLPARFIPSNSDAPAGAPAQMQALSKNHGRLAWQGRCCCRAPAIAAEGGGTSTGFFAPSMTSVASCRSFCSSSTCLRSHRAVCHSQPDQCAACARNGHEGSLTCATTSSDILLGA